MNVSQRARIRMSDDEVASFLEQGRTATIGSGGFPHLVAMWYGLVDGRVDVQCLSATLDGTSDPH